jgi:DNA-binding response OmpR family regulator
VAQTILVIDDDTVLQKILRPTLTKAGYSVLMADNGEEGIKKALEQPPDLIILDTVMPGMDGGEVARFLQMNPETQKIPIIFLSALITESKKKLERDKSTMTYLSKPFNRDELLNEVKRLLSG